MGSNPLHLLKTKLARQYVRLYPRDLFIGVSGSIYKTICVQISNAVLSKKFKTVSTNSSLNPADEFIKTILKIKPGVDRVILEMNSHMKGEIDFYLSLVKPQTAILTKIYYDHSEYLGSLDEIIEEESKLIEQLPQSGVAILNWDDPSCRKLAKKCGGQVIYYGTDPNSCSVWAGNVKIENFKTTFELNYGVERVKVNLKLLGAHFIYPALASAALGIINGIPLTKIKLALEEVEQGEHEMELYPGPSGSIILDDTKSSSPSGVDAAIDTLLQLNARRRVLVLGEMKDLGMYSEKLHRNLAQKIYKEKIDFVFLGQGDTSFIADELKSLGFWEERLDSNLQNSQLVSKLLKNLGKGDVVLIKGPRVVRLDEVVKRIAKKA